MVDYRKLDKQLSEILEVIPNRQESRNADEDPEIYTVRKLLKPIWSIIENWTSKLSEILKVIPNRDESRDADEEKIFDSGMIQLLIQV